MDSECSKAQAAGLRYRPLAATARDTLAGWEPAAEGECRLLDEWHAAGGGP